MTLTETEVLIYGETILGNPIAPKYILRILPRTTVMMKKVKFSMKVVANTR